MTSEGIIVWKDRKIAERTGRFDEQTGCYCPTAKGFCEKFVAPSDNFFKENCEKCHFYGELHERQVLAYNELLLRRRELVLAEEGHKKVKRSWFDVVGSLDGVKARE